MTLSQNQRQNKWALHLPEVGGPPQPPISGLDSVSIMLMEKTRVLAARPFFIRAHSIHIPHFWRHGREGRPDQLETEANHRASSRPERRKRTTVGHLWLLRFDFQ